MKYAVVQFKVTRPAVTLASGLAREDAISSAAERYEAKKQAGSLVPATSVMVLGEAEAALLVAGLVSLRDVRVEYQCGSI